MAKKVEASGYDSAETLMDCARLAVEKHGPNASAEETWDAIVGSKYHTASSPTKTWESYISKAKKEKFPDSVKTRKRRSDTGGAITFPEMKEVKATLEDDETASERLAKYQELQAATEKYGGVERYFQILAALAEME